VIPLRILTLADIHGNKNACAKLVSLMQEKETIIDLIIIAGDLPATTSLPVMVRYMLTHPLKALSKKGYTSNGTIHAYTSIESFVKKRIH